MSTATPTGASAGRRRFWITVVIFAVANLAAWVGYHQYATSRLHLLRVVKYEPGHEALVGPRPTFSWEFNLDVSRDLAKDGTPGIIAPHVAGKWLWHDGRTLTFTPDADLPRATRFAVTLPAERIRTTEGIRLDKPFSESFNTGPLKWLATRQSEFDAGDHLLIELEFDDSVIPADVGKHLALKDPENHPLAFHPHGDAAGKIVRFQTDPLPQLRTRGEAFVRVEVSRGLAGTSGPMGLATDFSQQLKIAGDVIATEAIAYSPGNGDSKIRLRFNNPVEIDHLRQVVSTEPPVKFQLSPDYDGFCLTGPFQPGSRYAVKIDTAPAGSDAKRFPRPDVLSAFVPDKSPEVWFEHAEGYLGSQGNRTILAHAVNLSALKVTVTRLYDSNLVTWRNAKGASRWDDPNTYAMPIATRAITLADRKNQKQDLRLSLDELLPAGAPRDGVYRIGLSSSAGSATHLYSRRRHRVELDEESEGNESASAIVTLSDIGLTAKQSRGGIHVWAVSLSSAKPLGEVRVRAYSNKNQPIGEARTDKDGLATLAGMHLPPGEHVAVLLAELSEGGPRLAGEAQPAAATTSQRGLTWLDLTGEEINFAGSDVAGKPYLRSGYEAFAYTDRGVYRPGETVHLRAIVRGPEQALPGAFPVRWQLRRPDQRDWKAEIVKLDADGAAALDVQLPDDLPTGRWSADIALPGENNKPGQSFGSVSFQVEEFMPARMKVKLEIRPEGAAATSDRVSMATRGIVAKVQADYLFGKPVTERPAKLTARIEPINFTSPQWPAWTFNDRANATEALGHRRATGGRIEFDEATLDAKGHATWAIAPEELLNAESAEKSDKKHKPKAATAATENPGPWRVTFFTAVTEAGGRAVNATQAVEVDRLPYYLGVRPVKSAITPGSPAGFEIACVAPGGSMVPSNGEFKFALYRDTWNTSFVYEGGRYRYNSTRKLDKIGGDSTANLTAGRGACTVIPPTGGAFVLVVHDGRTGCMTSHPFYAANGAWDDNVSREHPEELELVIGEPPLGTIESLRSIREHLDGAMVLRAWHGHPLLLPVAAKFKPGQTAQVIVRSPFAGRLLLSVETDSVLTTRVLDMPASQMAIPVEIPANSRPSAFITATVVRPIDANAKWRTHRAFGIARVPIDNTDRKLAVKIQSPAEMRPGNTLQVDMQVTDTTGKPAANAAVTVAAVDEGILSLTNFATPDPFGFFTAKRAHGVHWADLYSHLMPEVARPDGASAVGGDADAAPAGRHTSPVSARRVKPVALMSGILHTDAAGMVHANLQVPEFAGQLRVMAVTYNGPAFGSSASNVFVRSPLLVQSSWPRFAAPEDRFTVPLVVFNNTKSEGKAEIRVLMTEGGNERFPYPLELAGSKDHQLVLATGMIKAGEQATVSFEVNASRCGVAKATLMASLNGEFYSENIELPVRPASPTISVGGYAIARPGEPAKIPVIDGMLEGTGELQVRAAPFPALELPRGIEYLDRYPYGCAEQTTSGCFPLIALGDLGPQIAPGVFGRERVEAKLQAGITRLIGMQTADGGISMWPGANQQGWAWASVYTAHFIVEAQAAGHKVPDDFRDHLLAYVRNLLNRATDNPEIVEAQTYACYVLALAGKPERAIMSRLTEIVNQEKPIRAGITLIAPEARFHLAAAWLAAGRRDLAMGLIPKTLPQPRAQRQLAGNVGSPVRDRAVLISTLLSIDPEHPALPAMVQQLADAGKARGWQSTQDAAFAVMALGKYVRQMKAAAPYDSARLHLDGDKYVAETTGGNPLACDPAFDGRSQFELRITGPENAKAYVSWLQTGVPVKPPADEDAGLKIRRRYLNARGEPIGGNVVHSGDLIQVELTLESPTALANLVIDDLLPAGLEVENARLQTAADARQVAGTAAHELNAFSHGQLDVRDDRLVVVGSLSGQGIGKFVYLARAVTPGMYVIPPVRGECMYDIGTHSLSGAGQTLRVAPASATELSVVR